MKLSNCERRDPVAKKEISDCTSQECLERQDVERGVLQGVCM